MKAKLNKVNEWIKENRRQKTAKEIWKTFTAKLRGHIQYYGVSHNAEAYRNLYHEAKKNRL